MKVRAQWRRRSRHRGSYRKKVFVFIIGCLISWRLFIISYSTNEPKIQTESDLPSNSESRSDPAQSPQPAASRLLDKQGSFASILKEIEFPYFYSCRPNSSDKALENINSECSQYQVSPANDTGSETVIFHISEDDCGFGKVLAEHVGIMNLTSYTLKKLPNHLVDFSNPPLPIIGTSDHYARKISSRSVSEFFSHITVWREFFHSNATSAVVVTDGYIPRSNIPTKFDHFHIALLDSNAQAYVLSREGASRLLAYATAFVIPLADLIRTLGKMNLLNILQIHEGSRKEYKYTSCNQYYSKSSSFAMSNDFPFYPPHHPLFRINDTLP